MILARRARMMGGMYEHRSRPLLPPREFALRLARHASAAFVLIAVSWLAGTLGYRGTEGMDWIDALTNAAMILTGMGPLTPLHTVAGKLFASCYALYSGMVFLVAAGVIVAPLAHRMLHKFHAEK